MKTRLYLGLLACLLSTTSVAQQYINPDLKGAASLNHTPVLVTAPDVPKAYSLFGEKVPLDIWDVRERFDRELLFNVYMQGTTAYIIKHTLRYMPVIERILKEQGVPDDMKYLCVAESALRNQVSKVGAAGFWQFMKGTAPSYGLYIDNEVDERFDPEKSTYAACKYLKQGYLKFGSWTASAASYNCGMGGYNGHAGRQGFTNFYQLYLPEETMRYIFRIMALKYILENQKALGFQLTQEDMYKPLPTKEVIVNYSLGDLAAYARSQGTDYKTIKFLNPWLSGSTLYNKAGRTYKLLLLK